MRMRRAVATCTALALVLGPGAFVADAGADKPPRTGFEKRNGEDWTTHKEELSFLTAVNKGSERVAIDVIGETIEGRLVHLVSVGHPRPPTAAQSRARPTILFVCSQHGNEPAGREACLQLLRDLAFTDDADLVRQLSQATVLFVPTANPDGRAANTRGNAAGIDINRDHLNLRSPEALAIAGVVGEYRPDAVLDLHEYGPSVPVIYDDEILYLWPRNLNIDDQVYDWSRKLADHIDKGVEEQGYSSDEYGMYAVGDQDVYQSAGDEDEGILRNAIGLRHAIGILIESAVSQDARNGPQEVTSEAEVNLRRVASQMAAALEALEFFRASGEQVARATAGAFSRAVAAGRKRNEPVYFGGADNDPPEESEVQDPPPCGYGLTAVQLNQVRVTLGRLGISYEPGGKPFVPLAQYAEPLIPLLLDGRGMRHAVEAKSFDVCPKAARS